MNTTEAKEMLEFEKVEYIPNPEKDVSGGVIGYVSSANDSSIFIKFQDQLDTFGWDNTTAQECNFKQVIALKGYYDGWIVDPKGRTLGHKSWAEAMVKGTPEDQQERLFEIGMGHFFNIFTHQKEKGLR